MWPHEEWAQYGERRPAHGLVRLSILGLIRTRPPFTQRKAHLNLARFLKCGIPTRRASHFHWGAMGLRTLHIGLEQEHAGVGLGTVVGECKSTCRLKVCGQVRKLTTGHSVGKCIPGAP